MENTQTKSLSGIPGLASVPILKYLFSQNSTENKENELVFVLIPHIIRGPDLLRGDTDMLDIGTASAISLRRSIAKPVSPAAVSTTQPPVPQNQAPQNPVPQSLVPPIQVPPTQVQPTPAAAGTGAFLFDPPVFNQAKGSTFTVNVMLSGGQNIHTVPVQLNYDPNQLQVVNVSNGGFLSQDGQVVALAHREDPATGTMQITASRPQGAGGVSGQGAVVVLTFMAKEAGQSALTITRGGARDPAMQPIAMSGAQAAITIQ